MEERLHDSLQKKKELLKEIHQWRKNNRRIVSSLLDLQADALPDPQCGASSRTANNVFRPWHSSMKASISPKTWPPSTPLHTSSGCAHALARRVTSLPIVYPSRYGLKR